MQSLLSKLKGGDSRSIGASNEVVGLVLKSPALLDELFDGLFADDPRVRAGAADALEKVSVQQAEWLQPHRSRLLNDATRIGQKEVRWHVAQIIGRLKLTPKQRKKVVRILRRYLETSESQIVKVSALQALADLAAQDHRLRPGVTRLARQALETDAFSLKARAKKLLRETG